MAQVIASLVAKIGADTADFTKGAGNVKSGLADIAKQYLSTAAVITAFGSAVAYSIESAAEAQRVDAQLSAVLESTGGAAGIARAELEELASSLSRVSTYDDEAIKSSEALLLTFTKVGSEAFPQATQAILDMSTAMGTDLQGATIQVGKALNDPINGISALSRVGVSFTDEQKKMIRTLVETGDTLGAQKIILAELSKEFGGSALEASKTYTGQIKILKNEVGNLSEAFGSKLIPVLSGVVGGMTDFISIQNDANKLMESGENTYRRAAIAQATIEEVNLRNSKAIDSATSSYTAWANAMQGEVTPAAEDNTAAIEELTKSNSEYLSIIGDVSDEISDYKENQADLTSEHADLLSEKQKLLDQGWWAESDAVQAVNDKLAENEEKQSTNADAMEESTHRRMLAMLEEQLSIDGLSEKESTFLLEQGVKWGIYSEEAISAMAAIQRQVDAMERNIDININVHTNYSEAGQAALTAQLAGEKGYTPNGHATGGSFVIPSNYGTEGFSLGGGDTASGGEGIKITPRGKSGNEDVIAAIERNRISEERLAQLFEGAMLRMRQ